MIRLQAERDKLSVFVEKVATEKLGVIPYEIAHAARRLIGGPRKIGV